MKKNILPVILVGGMLVLGLSGCQGRSQGIREQDQTTVVTSQTDSGQSNSSQTTSQTNNSQNSSSQTKTNLTKLDPVLHTKADLALDLDIPTLMFHYIEDISPDTSDQMRYNLSYSPAKFEKLLQNLQNQGVEALTFWDIKAIAEGTRTKPTKGVILTFDDGYLSQYSDTFRLLKQYKMKGVFFIITSEPDSNPNYATWAQIKEMAEAGMEIGSHTVYHYNLTTIDSAALDRELTDSKKIIEEKTGQPVITFCYPSGRYNQAVQDAVSKYYLFARTTTHFEKNYWSWQNRWEINTVRMFPTSNPALLADWWS
jgi:peptidoglycan/xylan/chitin deacetylase (PgdA/CDA1 family)